MSRSSKVWVVTRDDGDYEQHVDVLVVCQTLALAKEAVEKADKRNCYGTKYDFNIEGVDYVAD